MTSLKFLKYLEVFFKSFRDKIYVTAKTDFTVKHKQTQENYTEYNTVDDNTYIIR